MVPNSYIDDMLKAAGCEIITPTERRCHFSSRLHNGQRSSRVQRGSQHLEREQEWHNEEGNVFWWRLEYVGQPFQCRRGFGIFHANGKCAAWEKKKEERSWGGQQKCFIVSSSMLRLASDTKKTRVDAIPGAKVAHIANHIHNDGDIFKQAEIVAIHAGANMD